jgi:prevent-host-death family protein
MKRKEPSAAVISTNDLRFDFGRVLKAVKSGKSMTLTYRNKPLARIVPLPAGKEVHEDDPLFSLHELAEPIGPMSNRQMDKTIYGG